VFEPVGSAFQRVLEFQCFIANSIQSFELCTIRVMTEALESTPNIDYIQTFSKGL
jgi:hypothetical protein